MADWKKYNRAELSEVDPSKKHVRSMTPFWELHKKLKFDLVSALDKSV
jgi:hypothetical protein